MLCTWWVKTDQFHKFVAHAHFCTFIFVSVLWPIPIPYKDRNWQGVELLQASRLDARYCYNCLQTTSSLHVGLTVVDCRSRRSLQHASRCAGKDSRDCAAETDAGRPPLPVSVSSVARDDRTLAEFWFYVPWRN